MTAIEQLHSLVDSLSEEDAKEVLYLLSAREQPTLRPDTRFIAATLAAVEDALARPEERLPHAAVREWLLSWGTPDEDAAEEALRLAEEQLNSTSSPE